MPNTQQQIAEMLEANKVVVPVEALPAAPQALGKMTSSSLTLADTLTAEEMAAILNGSRPLYCISWGVGRDSTVLAVAAAEKVIDIPVDCVMVANVGDGNETPETYATFEFYKNYFVSRGIPVIVVTSVYGGLEDYCFGKFMFPSRKRRDCTGKFKIKAMRDYLKAHFGTKAKFVKYIGYNKDEEKSRMANAQNVKNPSYEILRYPLIEAGITRAMEAPFLQERGLPVPAKSGCFFCPYTRQAGWIWLFYNHRELYERAQLMEDLSHELAKGWTLTSITVEFKGQGLGSLAALKIRILRGDFKDKITADAEGRLHCERDMGAK